jgi:hypothetical protein
MNISLRGQVSEILIKRFSINNINNLSEIKINLQKAGFKKETNPSDNVSYLLFKSVYNCLSYVSLSIYAS